MVVAKTVSNARCLLGLNNGGIRTLTVHTSKQNSVFTHFDLYGLILGR